MDGLYTITTLALALMPVPVLRCCMKAVRGRRVLITNSVELIPLAFIIAEFLDLHRFKANTWRAYRRHLEVFSTWLAEQKGTKADKLLWADVTRYVVEAFRDSRQRVESASTVRARLDTLKSLSTFASEQFQAPNHAHKVKSPPMQLRRFKGLTDQHYTALMRVIESAPLRDRFVIQLLVWTGLREAEASHLTCGQIADDWQWFLNVRGKGDKERDIPISKALKRSLMRYLVYRQCAPTLPDYPLLTACRHRHNRSAESYRLSTKAIYNTVRKWCLRAGVPASLSHPHALRHTFARRALEHFSRRTGNAGRALEMVQSILGHASINTTMIYLTHERQEAVEAMEEFA